MQQFIFLLSYCYLYLILHYKFWSVLTRDILGKGFICYMRNTYLRQTSVQV